MTILDVHDALVCPVPSLLEDIQADLANHRFWWAPREHREGQTREVGNCSIAFTVELGIVVSRISFDQIQ